jgi:hypothetical protein
MLRDEVRQLAHEVWVAGVNCATVTVQRVANWWVVSCVSANGQCLATTVPDGLLHAVRAVLLQSLPLHRIKVCANFVITRTFPQPSVRMATRSRTTSAVHFLR